VEISANKKLWNAFVAFVLVAGFIYWAWSHPFVDYYFLGRGDAPYLRLVDYGIIAVLGGMAIFKIVAWLRNR